MFTTFTLEEIINNNDKLYSQTHVSRSNARVIHICDRSAEACGHVVLVMFCRYVWPSELLQIKQRRGRSVTAASQLSGNVVQQLPCAAVDRYIDQLDDLQDSSLDDQLNWTSAPEHVANILYTRLQSSAAAHAFYPVGFYVFFLARWRQATTFDGRFCRKKLV